MQHRPTTCCIFYMICPNPMLCVRIQLSIDQNLSNKESLDPRSECLIWCSFFPCICARWLFPVDCSRTSCGVRSSKKYARLYSQISSSAWSWSAMHHTDDQSPQNYENDEFHLEILLFWLIESREWWSDTHITQPFIRISRLTLMLSGLNYSHCLIEGFWKQIFHSIV